MPKANAPRPVGRRAGAGGDPGLVAKRPVSAPAARRRPTGRKKKARPPAKKPPPPPEEAREGPWKVLCSKEPALWEVAAAAVELQATLGGARRPAELEEAVLELVRPPALANLFRALVSGEPAAYPVLHVLHLCAMHQEGCRVLVDRQCVPMVVGVLRAARDEELVVTAMSLLSEILTTTAFVLKRQIDACFKVVSRIEKREQGERSVAGARALLRKLQAHRATYVHLKP